MRKKIRKIFVISLALAASAVFLAVVYLQTVMNEEPPLKDKKVIAIEPGTSISAAIDSLAQKDALEPVWLFKLWAKLYTRLTGEKIYAGIYSIKPGETNSNIFYKLFKGAKDNAALVTLPEGFNVNIYASILQKKADIDSAAFLNLLSDDSLKVKYGIKSPDSEGYLMPNTYEFLKRNHEAAVKKLLNEGLAIWDTKRLTRLKEINMTKHEVLTLASIIEAETPVKEEAPEVSGVYHNRLRIGMPLQADPTVQYALKIKRKLTYADLKYDSPYNTYFYKGLPPGPINNPGLNAIDAALYPKKHNYIYFVAVGDSSGRHNFAANKSQHDKNVRSYRKSRKNAELLLK